MYRVLFRTNAITASAHWRQQLCHEIDKLWQNAQAFQVYKCQLLSHRVYTPQRAFVRVNNCVLHGHYRMRVHNLDDLNAIQI